MHYRITTSVGLCIFLISFTSCLTSSQQSTSAESNAALEDELDIAAAFARPNVSTVTFHSGEILVGPVVEYFRASDETDCQETDRGDQLQRFGSTSFDEYPRNNSRESHGDQCISRYETEEWWCSNNVNDIVVAYDNGQQVRYDKQNYAAKMISDCRQWHPDAICQAGECVIDDGGIDPHRFQVELLGHLETTLHSTANEQNPIDKKAYLIGGQADRNGSDLIREVNPHNLKVTPWSERLPEPVVDAASVFVLNGSNPEVSEIWVFGGSSDDENEPTSTAIHRITLDSHQVHTFAQAELPHPTKDAAAILVDGIAYIVGGNTDENQHPIISVDLRNRNSPQVSTIQTTPPLNQVIKGATLHSDGQMLWILGGERDGSHSRAIQEVNLSTLQIRTTTDVLPHSIIESTSVLDSTREQLYIYSGYNNGYRDRPLDIIVFRGDRSEGNRVSTLHRDLAKTMFKESATMMDARGNLIFLGGKTNSDIYLAAGVGEQVQPYLALPTRLENAKVGVMPGEPGNLLFGATMGVDGNEFGDVNIYGVDMSKPTPESQVEIRMRRAPFKREAFVEQLKGDPQGRILIAGGILRIQRDQLEVALLNPSTQESIVSAAQLPYGMTAGCAFSHESNGVYDVYLLYGVHETEETPPLIRIQVDDRRGSDPISVEVLDETMGTTHGNARTKTGCVMHGDYGYVFGGSGGFPYVTRVDLRPGRDGQRIEAEFDSLDDSRSSLAVIYSDALNGFLLHGHSWGSSRDDLVLYQPGSQAGQGTFTKLGDMPRGLARTGGAFISTNADASEILLVGGKHVGDLTNHLIKISW